MMRRRAFTLFEMVLTIGIIGIVAAMVIPTSPGEGRLRLIAAAGLITSDIELAQTMTMSHPDQAVLVKFDDANDTYWLAYASDPEVPLTREDTGDPYLVVLGEGRAATADGVTFTSVDMASGELRFNAQGGVVDITTSPSVQIDLDAESVILNIATTTGSVTEN